MSRRNEGKTDAKQLKRMRERYIEEVQGDLRKTQKAIESEKDQFVLDLLFCELHRLQKRYDKLKGLN